MRRLALIALLMLASLSSAKAQDELLPLRDAVARYPDDPDLLWALGRGLADAAESEEAIAVLRDLVARWPDRANAQQRLGQELAAQGRDAEALPFLEGAVALEPRSGSARMALAMSLDRVGRFSEADAQLIEAAELDPSLRPSSLLLRAVSLIERGEEEAGFRLLEEILDLDPLSDVAKAARLLLARRDRPPRPRFQLQAYGGMDYDSNATLDSGSTPGLSSDQSDGAAVWGAIASFDAWTGELHRVTLGARYHERDYLEIDRLDERTFLGFLSAYRDLGSRVAGRLSAFGSYVMLDDHSYLGQAKLRPELLVWLGEGVGVLQVAAMVEGDFYHDDPPFPSLERDAVSFGGELAHLFTLPTPMGTRGSWGVSYERVITDAHEDLLGFDGDYDRHAFGGHARVELPVGWRVELEPSVGAVRELYDHDNLVDYLAQLEASGSGDPRRRKDVLLWVGVALRRPIAGPVELELHWRFHKRFSNTDVYDYDRHIVGAMLRVATF